MIAVKGHIKNNKFVSDDGTSIPEGSRVVVTVLNEEIPVFSETERQRRAWADFFEAIENDPEELSPEFDEIISRGIKFREIDFS
jgi:hypothetical protein